MSSSQGWGKAQISSKVGKFDSISKRIFIWKISLKIYQIHIFPGLVSSTVIQNMCNLRGFAL